MSNWPMNKTLYKEIKKITITSGQISYNIK